MYTLKTVLQELLMIPYYALTGILCFKFVLFGVPI